MVVVNDYFNHEIYETNEKLRSNPALVFVFFVPLLRHLRFAPSWFKIYPRFGCDSVLQCSPWLNNFRLQDSYLRKSVGKVFGCGYAALGHLWLKKLLSFLRF